MVRRRPARERLCNRGGHGRLYFGLWYAVVMVVMTVVIEAFVAPQTRKRDVSRRDKENCMNAKDIMTSPVLSVSPDTPVREIAALLFERRISGLPVLENGRLVGIVSEA